MQGAIRAIITRGTLSPRIQNVKGEGTTEGRARKGGPIVAAHGGKIGVKKGGKKPPGKPVTPAKGREEEQKKNTKPRSRRKKIWRP